MAVRRQRRDWMPAVLLVTLGLFAVFAVFVLVRAATGGGSQNEQRVEECESDYSYLLQIESFGHSAQNSHLWDDFEADCAEQADALDEFIAARATAREAANDCDQLEAQVGARLLRLLESYGECDGVPLAEGYETMAPLVSDPQAEGQDLPTLGQPAEPGGDAIEWSEAAQHAGTVQRVCGPLSSVRGTEDGTFVNVGVDYPSTNRFTFVFWGISLSPIDTGSTVCGVGEIYLYEGVVAQIELRDAGELEVWR